MRPSIGGALAPRTGGHGEGGAPSELLSQQLEMDGHRVERVLDLMRDAGQQPVERRQLARVTQHRLQLRQRTDVARHQHDPDESYEPHRQSDAPSTAAGARLALFAGEVRMNGPRDARTEMACSTSTRHGCASGTTVASAAPGSSAGSNAFIAAFTNATSPLVPTMATASRDVRRPTRHGAPARPTAIGSSRPTD